jgi:hypothetical protein
LREWTPLADQGYAKAQHNLEVMYFGGQGVSQDYVTAHMWANFAAMNGSEIAPELQSLIGPLPKFTRRRNAPKTALPKTIKAVEWR